MSFESILGQKDAVESLRRRLAAKAVPHALLFTGPDGVGKRATAVEFAKALLCEKNGANACDACCHCKKIDSKQHPDIFFITPNDKGNIQIASVREAISRSQMKPFEALFQLVVIDSAEAMGDEAQNALLKVLEEPPKGAHFVLISSEPHLLYPTVLSRCQRVAFEALSDVDVATILASKCGVERPDAERMARLGRGSVLQALSAGDVDFRRAEDRAFECVAAAKTGATIAAGAAKPAKKDALFELDCLADVFRDILILKAAPHATPLFNAERASEVEAAAAKYSMEETESILEVIGEVREGADQSLNLKLLFLKLWDEMGLRVPV